MELDVRYRRPWSRYASAMDDMVGRGKMVMQKEGTPGYLNR